MFLTYEFNNLNKSQDILKLKQNLNNFFAFSIEKANFVL